MISDILSLIDFAKVNTLLEGFNKSTGFVTAVLDLDGNVLSKSGWRQICTDFHRIHPETSKKCTVSDTVLAGKMAEGEKYHFYKCLNGLVDVAVPIIINGEHIANLFSGQFFFEEADKSFFEKQSQKYGFNKDLYLEALSKVPVVSKDEVQNAMEFLLNMTELITDMTFQKLEQQKLIEALKKSESLFQDLVETTQDLIWQCDAEGRYIYLNPAWEEVFGYKAEEMLGKKFTDFQTAEWAERDLKEFRRLLKGNIIKGLETVHIAKNGNEINLIFNAKIVFDENGKAIGSSGSAFNASNIRKTEKELQKKENQYTMLFNSMNEGVAIHEVIFDNNGKAVDYRIVDLNSAFEKHTGIEIEKAKNQKASDFYKTGTAPYLDIYSNVAITAAPTRFETYFPPLNKYFEISVFSPHKASFATVFTDITERKLMEVAIKKERDEAQLYFDIAGVMFTILNTKGEIVKINKKGCEILGYSDENEIIGANWFDVTLPLHVKGDVYKVYNQLMRGKIEAVEYYENPVLTKTGNERIIAFHNTVLFDDESNICGILFSGEDITERKNAEEELKRSEQEFRSLAESMPQIVWATRADGWNIYFNQQWMDYTGLTLEESYGHGWNKPFHPDDQQRAWIAWNNAVNNNDIYSIETRLRRFDGEYRWWLVRGVPLIDENGKIIKWFGTCTDIEELKQTQKELRENEELLRLSTELANVAAWEFDFTTNSMTRSKNHDSLYGLEPQETWAFETFVNATHPEDRELSNSTIQNSVAPGGPDKYKFDFRVIYSDQSVHWLNVIGEVIKRNEKGEGLLVRGFLIDITDRKLAAEAYQEAAANLKSLIDNRQDSIWSLDRNLNYIIFNSTYEQIFLNQYQVELKKGMNAVDYLTPESAEFWIPKFESAFEGESITFEFSHPFDSGIRYFQTSINPIYENQVVTGASAISVDITDRRLAEEKLRLSEEKFSNAFYTSPAAISIVRASDGLFLDVNNSFLKLFEYSREEVIGHTTLEINMIGPEERTIIMQKIEETGGLTNAELTLKSKSNRKVHLLVSSKPITILDDVCNLSTMIDITEWKQAEKSLHESEEKYRSIYENSSVAILLTSPDGSILTANDFACQLFDRTEKEICEAGRNGLIDISDPRLPLMLEKRKIEGKVTGELTLLKKNGIKFLGEVSSVVFIDKEGNHKTSMVIRDLTEQKKAEQEINALNQYLEQRVKERTVQLEAANKELETFTYSVSHDLKAPLRGIDGYSKLLLDLYSKELNEEARFFINTIRNSTQQMNQLIEDLLEYSRLERSELKNDKIEIKNLINDITSYFKNELIAKDYSLEINVNDIEIDTDEKGLTIVLRNLLENAIKFSSGIAKPVIEINLEEKQLSWVISVKDNGIGFDMKYQKRIFEIFQRLQRAEDFPGTGIGLAIVNKAIQRMKGKVWAESTVGIGSIFYVEIFKKSTI